MSITRQVKLIDCILGDTVLYRLTDHQMDVIANGEIYRPLTPFEVSAIEFKSGIDAANAVLTIAIDSLIMTTYRFLKSGTLHGLTFKIYFHHLDTNFTQLILYSYAESATFNSNSVEISLLSLIGKLGAVNLTKKLAVNCNHSLGDDYCKVDRLSYGVSSLAGACVMVNPYQLQIPTLPTATQFSNNGTVSLALNSEYGGWVLNIPYRTLTNYGGVYVLNLLSPCYLSLATDVVSITVLPGCDKTKASCLFFNNIERFSGFAGIRGKLFSDKIPVRV